jgi:hypothetical protein
MNKPAHCIFINTPCEGAVPSVRDENDLPCWFPTQLEAEKEIADDMITRLQEFIEGDRDFDDAISTEGYVVEATLLPDGSIIDAHGNHFGSRRSKARS